MEKRTQRNNPACSKVQYCDYCEQFDKVLSLHLEELVVDEAILIQPQDAADLRDVGRVLRRSPAKLVGPKGEHATLPEPLYDLLKDIVKNLAEGHSLVLVP